jgi:hypothetical protein
MDPAGILERVFAEILREARGNPSFGARLALALAASNVASGGSAAEAGVGRDVPDRSSRRGSHRRARAIIDPLAIHQGEGEDRLRAALGALTMEELKDIVAEHGMDTNKLAMKWRTRERLEDLIVTTVRDRLSKGSVFRRGPAA